MPASRSSEAVKTLSHAASELRVSNGIVVVGAGASFEAGMPLAGQLASLVWQTLDDHRSVRQITAAKLGIPDSDAKHLVGDNRQRITAAFEAIDTDSEARSEFQQTFARLDRVRRSAHSAVHDALARLIQSRIVEFVVSLNWDTLLETSFTNLYGTGINAHAERLTKPHGDANYPELNWVLPHQQGNVPPQLVQKVQTFVADRPRVLVVVGYSEQDEVIVERLIRPVATRWRIYRIGPNATGEGAIRISAKEALGELAKELCPSPEVPGWNYLTFTNQRGLAAAISGERLSPADVESCPRLPQIDEVRRSLQLLNCAVICGPPGCGKSITAYQVANDLLHEGWQVLRLAHPIGSPEELLRTAKNAPTPKLLLIDDGQLLGDHFLEEVKGLAAGRTAVLIAMTELDTGDAHSIQISNNAAVKTLRDAFLERRDEVLAIVSKLDRHVGERYGDTPIEYRIQSAASAETPWQFNFILRGSWRRAAEELTVLKDLRRADVLLLAISACQIAYLDNSVDKTVLYRIAQYLGRDQEWVDRTLDVLRRRGNLLRSLEIRCPHIRFSSVVIERWFDDKLDPEFGKVVGIVRSLLAAEDTPLQGVSWLLNALKNSETWRFADDDELVRAEDRDSLILRCLNSEQPRRRKEALWVLGQLCRWRGDICERITGHSQILGVWLENIEDEYADAMASFLNWLWNFDHDKQSHSKSATAILNAACPQKVANCFPHASHAHGRGWGEFLSRIYSHATPEWRKQFWTVLNKDWVITYAAGFASSQLFELSNFLQGLAPFEEGVTFAALEHSLPAIELAIQGNPLNAFEDIDTEITWSILGYSWFRRKKPDKRQARFARKIVSFFPVDRIASDLSHCRQRDWERYGRMLGWIHEVDANRHHRIARSVDFSQLSKMSQGLWKQPPRELRLLISALVAGDDGEPSRSWVAEHENEIRVIDPLTAIAAPDVAVRIAKRGGNVDLQGHNGDWATQARALYRIKMVDAQVAAMVATGNETHLVNALDRLDQTNCEDDDIAMYLTLLKEFDGDLLRRTVEKLDPGRANIGWKRQLRNRRSSGQRVVAILASVGSTCAGSIAEVSRELLPRIPNRVLVSLDQ